MKEKIVDSLWQQIEVTADWIKQAQKEQNIGLLGWCTDYLNLTKQSLLSLQNIFFPVPEVKILPTVPEKLEISRGSIPQSLTGFQRQGLSVLLGLTEGHPQTLAEAARMAWPDEFTEDNKARAKLLSRISWVKSNGSAKLKQLLQENASCSPEDTEFLKSLKEKYPDITAEKVDELLELPKKEKEKPVILLEPEPEREWLRPLWAVFFHQDGPSLETNILAKRTGLSEDFVQPCINGGIKSLQEVIDGKIAEPEALEFIAGLKSKWPGKSLEEIVCSIRGEENASTRATGQESSFDS